MLKNQPIIRFAIILLISYFALNALVSFTPAGAVMNAMFRELSETVLSVCFSDLNINTKAERAGGAVDDNKMIVEFKWTQSKINEIMEEARRTGRTDIEVPYRFISFLIFEFFLVPLIFLLALIIATPMPSIKDKIIGGVLSIFAMLIFLYGKMYVMTIFSVSKAKIDVYELSDSTMNILLTVVSLMTMGLSVIVAFFLWLIFMFRKSEIKNLMTSWFNTLLERE